MTRRASFHWPWVSGRRWHGQRRTRGPPGIEMSLVTKSIPEALALHITPRCSQGPWELRLGPLWPGASHPEPSPRPWARYQAQTHPPLPATDQRQPSTGSTARCWRNGPTSAPTTPRPSALQPFPTGYMPTIPPSPQPSKVRYRQAALPTSRANPTSCEVDPLPKGLYLGRFRSSGLILRAYCPDDERQSYAERDDADQDQR